MVTYGGMSRQPVEVATVSLCVFISMIRLRKMESPLYVRALSSSRTSRLLATGTPSGWRETFTVRLLG